MSSLAPHAAEFEHDAFMYAGDEGFCAGPRALEPDVVEHARRTHPYVIEGGVRRKSSEYGGIEAAAAPFDEPLPEAPADADELAFEVATLDLVRMFVATHARDARLPDARTE